MSQTIFSWEKVDIDISEFTRNVQRDMTENVVTGDGLFDTMMETATQHLLAQWDANRIRGEDYATAYIQIYQATLAATVQIWLQKGIAEKQLESEEAKKALYLRQIEGFDEDFKQKILKIQLDSYAVGLSIARDNFIGAVPVPMQKPSIDDLYQNFVKPELDNFDYGRKTVQLMNLRADNKLRRATEQNDDSMTVP